MKYWFIQGVLAVTGVLHFLFPAAGGEPLKSFPGCVLEPMPGADGDSFRVRFPDGKSRVIRLYAVDCVETEVRDLNDSRRLRDQRRYFGITRCRGTAFASIREAKRFGRLARTEVESILSKPFTVHTVFADGRGSGYHKRYYAFVTTGSGRDLGAHLVEAGLARVHGVCRTSPSGRSGDDLRAHLKDLELKAAKLGRGIWALTDWDTLPEERSDLRKDASELELAVERKRHTGIVDPNTATREELCTLSGIGAALADRIIAHRPYRSARDLLEVRGIGEKTLEKNLHRLPREFRAPADASGTSGGGFLESLSRVFSGRTEIPAGGEAR